jgi:hypothetical protein
MNIEAEAELLWFNFFNLSSLYNVSFFYYLSLQNLLIEIMELVANFNEADKKKYIN